VTSSILTFNENTQSNQSRRRRQIDGLNVAVPVGNIARGGLTGAGGAAQVRVGDPGPTLLRETQYIAAMTAAVLRLAA